METLFSLIKKIVPKSIFHALQPIYHYKMAFFGALTYNFPSRHIKVVFITGTKGKSSTTEILNSILVVAGKKTAMAGTIRFKIADKMWQNKFKMTTPGRFFLQRFLRQAVDAGCEYAIIEMSSEAARQFRHKFINTDALLFLNISPEHIESHGGYDNYLASKLLLAQSVEKSNKRPRIIIAHRDDKESQKFLAINAEIKKTFSIDEAKPFETSGSGSLFKYKGLQINTVLAGEFNIRNILAAAAYAEIEGVSPEIIRKGVEQLTLIPGRVQKIDRGQKFDVVIDYAHTADSLEKLYTAFSSQRKICVLGNTGGGRDTWKRPEMGKVADSHCDTIILTNEDPYDEDPEKIIKDMVQGIKEHTPEIIMDRRKAINKALTLAKQGDAVLISGKGTDPYIMEAKGKKTPWSDARVAEEELQKILKH